MIFVDTNYFLRYFLKDIPSHHKIAKKLFTDGVKGSKKLFTSTIVIFEIYWVFTSFYQKTKNEVIDILNKTISLNFIKIVEREVIKEAIYLFNESNLDFEDCFNLVFARNNEMKDFATFDKKLENYLKKST